MPMPMPMPMPTAAILTMIAMIAFAGNSILCRMALGGELIDAASFTSIRVISGALVLTAFALRRPAHSFRQDANWRAALVLFIYMVSFSFAYLSLTTATGALVLFGAAQLTMFAAALRSGETFSLWAWLGLLIAVTGLVYLLLPGVAAPSPLGAMLMTVAGVAWGLYSLNGKRAQHPTRATAWNFLLCVPLVVATSLLFREQVQLSNTGIALAVASGVIASGLGYVIWYAALRRLAATSAATVQLSVPAIAAIGGVLLLSEPLTLRLVVASVATLGGVAVVLWQRLPPR
jgi:drug/metabolite transporter (DMT)-like permease